MGESLYVNFVFEDWTLLQLRYELFLLVHAFKHDIDDEENPGVHESNLGYYFTKYYSKTLTPKHYQKESLKELVEFVKDTVSLNADSSVLNTGIETDVDSRDIFVKLTEEGRRE